MRLPALARSVSLVVAVLSICAASASANPITVTIGPTAAQMVANLVGSNPGITVTPGSEIYAGASVASGLFGGADGILPFTTGVVLTSGGAAAVPGPNNAPDSSFAAGTGSDADLDLLAPGTTIHADAATLTFKFKTTSNMISFQYVFGSEEYPEFVGSGFNDVFGFFLDGVNIALIPSTLTPVTINNVNASLNSQYFTSNPDGLAAPFNIQYDGLVGAGLPLFATRTFAVDPNFEHTIKFGVEDVGDDTFDSGVFLAAGSFVAQPPTVPENPAVPEPTTLVTLGSVLVLARLWRRRKSA